MWIKEAVLMSRNPGRHHGGWFRIVVGTLCVAMGFVSCQSAATVRVSSIDFEVADHGVIAEAQSQVVRDKCIELLKQSGNVLAWRPGEQGYILEIKLGPVVAMAAGGQMVGGTKGRVISVALRSKKPALAAYEIGYYAVDGTDLMGIVLGGLDKTLPNLTRFVSKAHQAPEAMLDFLSHSDVRYRRFAVERLLERRPKGLVKALCESAKGEKNRRLRLRLVGALAELGDSSAVDTLVALTHRQDDDFVRQVIYAIGALGGRRAYAFLVTMAGGHPSLQVQLAAKEALADISFKVGRQ